MPHMTRGNDTTKAWDTFIEQLQQQGFHQYSATGYERQKEDSTEIVFAEDQIVYLQGLHKQHEQLQQNARWYNSLNWKSNLVAAALLPVYIGVAWKLEPHISQNMREGMSLLLPLEMLVFVTMGLTVFATGQSLAKKVMAYHHQKSLSRQGIKAYVGLQAMHHALQD